jgi:glycosyltransferase involved in cell wall biosynthesis
MGSDIPRIVLVSMIDDPFDPPGFERFGGGQIFLFDLGRFLVQIGYKVTFITRLNSSSKAEFAEIGPLCEIYRLAVGPPKELWPAEVGSYLDELCLSFKTLLSDKEFSVIHSHSWIAGEAVWRFRSERYIRHIHSIQSLGRANREAGQPLGSSAAVRDQCELHVFTAADALIVLSAVQHSNLSRLYPEVDLAKTHVIPHGVDPDVFYPRPQPEDDFVCRQTLGFPKRIDITSGSF